MEAEFEANKQQRGANLNKVTQHLGKAEMGNFIFFYPTARAFTFAACLLGTGEIGGEDVGFGW